MINPNLLPFGMTLDPSKRTKSPLGPFINPGIGQAVGQAVQQYQPAPQPQSMGSRIQGILGTLLGAQDRTELSKGLLDFGARMMAASAPGANTSFLGALGQSLPGTRQALEGQRQTAALDSLMDPRFRGLPPQIQAQLFMANQQGSILPAGAIKTDLEGNIIADNRIPTAAELPELLGGSDLYRGIAGDLGIVTEEDMLRSTPAQRAELWNRLQAARADEATRTGGGPSPQGGVNVVVKGLQEAIGNVQSSAEIAFDQMPVTIEALDILKNTDTRTGPGTEQLNSLKTFVGNVTGQDVSGIADFDRLTQIAADNQIAKLKAFKGPTSDKELAHVQKASADVGRSVPGNIRYFEGLRDLYAWQIAMNDDLVNAAQEAYSRGTNFTEFDANQVIRKWRNVDIDGFYERNRQDGGYSPNNPFR